MRTTVFRNSRKAVEIEKLSALKKARFKNKQRGLFDIIVRLGVAKITLPKLLRRFTEATAGQVVLYARFVDLLNVGASLGTGRQ
jgi:ABC-type polysaccharide/polyol phosphate transport system ATPase subunit